jgi:hypothetical protein
MRRSRTVTLLAALVFLLGLIQVARAVALFLRRDLLAQFNLSIPLPYAIGSAMIWGVLLGVAAFGLWRLAYWSWSLTLVGVTASQAQAWLDRCLFARSDYAQTSIGFDLGITVIVLVLTWGVLWWQRKRFLRS